ncbi:zf-HC2 domain-containing protein [Nonomuraea pusilla]|uniref:Putative zinc-finger n=1 Tax=Nonomuraea pusilla TaxID=46177 RepID=A0A1H8FSY4_9ACTN|nr:zf-HC2 domain-containing protein [Nonomuraea pusilla]SEN34921.1 Putative zinc-finger [Nonomuraea pusilla]
MTWHVSDDLREGYLGGGLDPALAMSVETHLARCAACRAAVPYEPEWLEESWRRLEARLVAPRPGPAERLLARCGVPAHLARLLMATPTLSRAWLAAVGAALAFAVLAARVDPAFVPAFLVAAPVLPPAGIALAYGPRVDPAYELLAATPLAGARLLLTRAAAVLSTAVVLAGAASPLLPAPPWLCAAWLLPSLAVTLACLALSRLVRVPLAALAVTGLWLAVAGAAGFAGDWVSAFAPAAQIGYAAAAAVLLLRLRAARTRGETDTG